MKIFKWAIALAMLLVSTAHGADDVLLPTVVPEGDLRGGVFEKFPFKIWDQVGQDGPFQVRDIVLLESEDDKLLVGIGDSDPVDYTNTKGYPYDEVMFFAKGGVELTNADGSVMTAGPGDTVTLPKGWTGRWFSPQGYRKVYIIYNPKRGPEAAQ